MPRLASSSHHGLRKRRVLISESPYIRDIAYRFGLSFPCDYCPHVARSESGRSQHILQLPACQQAKEQSPTGAALLVVEPRTGKKSVAQRIKPDKVTYELLGDGAVDLSQECLIRLHSPSPSPIPLAQPLSPPRTNGCAPLEYDARLQVFVERFKDPRAGAPINDKVAQPLNLKAYMASVGNLANSDYFDRAELLMTTGLTNTGRDAHLKSRLYVGQTPWKTNKSLIADIDKLPHGPVWDVYDIDLHEAAQRAPRKHTSYHFKRSVIDTFRDLFSNPAFKDHVMT
ncbi:hypothetical protein FRC09_006339 [Ceratobasidium sp. 395]|nr:hypothetical protein FRC09_006339 [Ceratobasidium sp. 395]